MWSSFRLSPRRPQTSSWRTGGWGLGLWSQAECWTQACFSSWRGCCKRWSWSRWCRVCSGPAGGRSPCPDLTWPQGLPSLLPLSVRRRPAGSAAECYSIWRTRQWKKLLSDATISMLAWWSPLLAEAFLLRVRYYCDYSIWETFVCAIIPHLLGKWVGICTTSPMASGLVRATVQMSRLV